MNESKPKKTEGDTLRGWRRRFLFPAILMLGPYLLAEFFFSLLYVHGVIYPPVTSWYFEESGRTLHFDPTRGYTLTTVPSRFVRFTYGVIEQTGVLRGNAQGFPDRDDFSAGRDGSGSLRVAVFGDSFTSAQFLEKNWPDLAEDILNGDPKSKRVELLNFSVDGGGLANWWSILKNIVEKENYQIDALLFATYRGNLNRTFSIAEHRGYSRHMFGRTGTWKVEDWPKTDREAREYLKPLEGYILSKDEYEKALTGKFNPALPRAWRPYFAMSVTRMLAGLMAGGADAADSSNGGLSYDELFSAEQEAIIRGIAEFARRKSIPIIVVGVPALEQLTSKPGTPMDTYHFSRLLGAQFVNGKFAYKGWTEKQIVSAYFPYDRHWNQIGSDAFARFMAYVLERKFADQLAATHRIPATATQ